MHAMLLSTTYNSLSTVLANLHHSFTEVAQKSYHYIKSLPPGKRPAGKLIVRTYHLHPAETPHSMWLVGGYIGKLSGATAKGTYYLGTNEMCTGTVNDLIKLSCILMRRRTKAKQSMPFECCVSDGQARW